MTAWSDSSRIIGRVPAETVGVSLAHESGLEIRVQARASSRAAGPGVVEAAVVAKPCPILGERVHAVVCTGPDGVDEAALSAHCAAQLADYQCPESFTIGTAPLPRNANGKILKRQIKSDLGFDEPETERARTMMGKRKR